MSGATEKRKALRGGATVSPKPEDFFPDPEEPEDDAAGTDAAGEEPEEDPIITVEDDGVIVVRLTQPLKPHDGKGEDPLKDLTKIRLRKMYAGDMMVIDKEEGTIGQVIALAKQLSGLPSIAIKRLHTDDFARVHGIVHGQLGNFLGVSRALSALSLG